MSLIREQINALIQKAGKRVPRHDSTIRGGHLHQQTVLRHPGAQEFTSALTLSARDASGSSGESVLPDSHSHSHSHFRRQTRAQVPCALTDWPQTGGSSDPSCSDCPSQAQGVTCALTPQATNQKFPQPLLKFH